MLRKDNQLSQLDQVFQNFVEEVNALSPAGFLQSIGDWTPRDIVAHLVGWNHNILTGCRQIMSGETPFYHSDALNDYRILNAEFIARYNSTDRNALLWDLAHGKDDLCSFLSKVDESEWDKDFGVRHYRGGVATVGRSVESLTRDYFDHTQEIRRR